MYNCNAKCCGMQIKLVPMCEDSGFVSVKKGASPKELKPDVQSDSVFSITQLTFLLINYCCTLKQVTGWAVIVAKIRIKQSTLTHTCLLCLLY